MKPVDTIAMIIVVGTMGLLALIGVAIALFFTYQVHPLLTLWLVLFLSAFAYATTKGDLI